MTKQKEATIKPIDGKATREFLAQLPMNVSLMDFEKREKFGREPSTLTTS